MLLAYLSVRFVFHVVVFRDFNQVFLHGQFGRRLNAHLMHQLLGNLREKKCTKKKKAKGKIKVSLDPVSKDYLAHISRLCEITIHC